MFLDVALHADILFAERFEGYHKTSDFTEEDWEAIYQMLNAILLNPFSEPSKQLMVSKQLVKPLEEIRKLSKNETMDMRYRIYSAHDTNIANWL